MFEVGKRYEFTILVPGETGIGPETSHWTVEAIDGNLLHLAVPAGKVEFGDFAQAHTRREMILNTSSQYFVSATPEEKPEY